MVDFCELEYKYKADDIKLTDFQKLMETIGYSKKLEVSSWDHYYTNKEPNAFIRFRDSAATPELTQKRKTVSENNWSRVEVDLPLDRTKIDEKTVSAFVNLLGFEKNFKIFKSCFIYWTKEVNFVYYIVYSPDMEEKGRFVEVEINKGSNADLDHLNMYADKLKVLGLSPQNRMKKSLYEMFVK